jgi:hypothetical protein
MIRFDCFLVLNVPMCVRMCTVIAELREGLAAVVAAMRFLPRVRPHVCSKAAGRREGLAACVAAMGLLPRMRSHVLGEVPGLGECLVACVEAMALLHEIIMSPFGVRQVPRHPVASRLRTRRGTFAALDASLSVPFLDPRCLHFPRRCVALNTCASL